MRHYLLSSLLACGECGATMHRWKNGSRQYKDRAIWRCSDNPKDHIAVHEEILVSRFSEAFVKEITPYLKKAPIAETVTQKPRVSKVENLTKQRRRL
jgi:hypothetical protein